MGFNSAFKGLKMLKTHGNGRLNNLNDPDRPQCVKIYPAGTVHCSLNMKSFICMDYIRVAAFGIFTI